MPFAYSFCKHNSFTFVAVATDEHKKYMQRCLELAKRGAGNVAPNPMVGAVLVYEEKIIGEGYHGKYGEAHAEVNCINDAMQNAPQLISTATLYTSLEPCAHFGKTPPCADLIIRHKIPHVVVACCDSFSKVNGKGIEKLKAAGVEVTEDVLKEEAIELNNRFFTFYEQQRPYIILKWAQTDDGFIGSDTNKRLMITNDYTNRMVHKWRSLEAGILIGATTAIKDDPLLNNRHWFGKAPVKIILDPHLRTNENLRLFQQGADSIVMNRSRKETVDKMAFERIDDNIFLDGVLQRLYELRVQSVLVEGGLQTLQSFIDAGLWDEARVITNTGLIAGSGMSAPPLNNEQKVFEEFILKDRVQYFKNAGTGFL